MYNGQKYPTTKLNLIHTQVEHSPRTPRIYKESEVEAKDWRRVRLGKIEKDKQKPCPGEYEDPKSYKATQLHGGTMKFSKLNRDTIFDIVPKRNKFVPGVGTYKFEVRDVYKKISTSPRSLSIRRH